MTYATRRGDPYAVDRIREAAALLRHHASRATPGPWRLGNSPYAALVADQPHPSRAHAENGGWAWDDGYGGCLVGESMMASDRVYFVTMQPEVGALLADLLDDVAAAPPPQVPSIPPASVVALCDRILGVPIPASDQR
jgi:hypothetical protein